MTSENRDNLLLVKGQSPQEDLELLLEDLKTLNSLDVYTLRQRLTGYAVNMLHKGERSDLEDLARILQRHHIPHWIVAPSKDLLEPLKPENIHRSTAGWVFTVNGTAHVLTQDSQPLIILADLTAQVGERILKQSQAQYTYTGGVHNDRNHDNLLREIFRQEPRLILAWGGSPRQPEHLIFLSPAAVPKEVLGDKAGLSRKWNLMEFLLQVRTACPEHYLDTGFGLGFLPDYRVSPCESSDYYALNKNNTELIRYANLILDMAENSLQPQQNATSGAARQAMSTVLGLATAFQLPKQAAMMGPAPARKKAAAPTKPSLPTPPAPNIQSGFSLHFNGWRLLSNLAAFALFFFVEINHQAAGDFYRYGFSTGLVPLAVSGLCLWNALFFWRIRQRIKNTATSKARSAAMGMVEMYGRAQRQFALVSPSSQQPCVYYRLKRYRRGPKDQWQLTSITSSDSVPFILEDDTGRITINPRGATFKLENSINGLDMTGADEKWVEEVIYENSMLYVLGFAATSHNHQGSLSHRVAEKLRNLKGNHDKLMRYDHDGDGQISPAEWDSARADMEQEALHEKLHQGEQRSNEQLVISAPPQRDLPFIIAETRSEAHLVTHYTWQVPVLLIAGVATFIWAIKACVSYFHLI
nr:hypothetical protein [uncultured Desulfuromonas sp.]